MKITKNTKIMNILNANPKAIEILFEAGLGCIGCHMSQYETLEQGCKTHGMNNKEINDIIEKLNKKSEKKVKKK